MHIPSELLPRDGRFGSGPSKVRAEAVEALSAVGNLYLGTSHRQAPVRSVVGRLRSGLTSLFGLPEGWEILLGNGGTTAFWDAATFGLLGQRSQHLVFGEFSGKFADVVRAAPHMEDPEIVEAPYGSHPEPKASDVDAYALTHNETSTGVAMPLRRPDGQGLVVVDATSAAGGLRWDPREVDVYYFAPQKCFGADGGFWAAACSPAAVERIERVHAAQRWVPASLDLGVALENSRKDQTYNTPALATLFLFLQQVDWMNDHGGMAFTTGRCDESASVIYGWAEESSYAAPFVAEPGQRSHVVATIDLDDAVPASIVSGVLRANGIVDTESYRKLGRNQLRVALFPAIDPDDVRALTTCIDHVVAALG